LGGDRIVANPGTLTGSIGVISEFIYIEGLLEKIGLERGIVKSGKYKDLGVCPLTEEQLSIMQKLSDTIYNQFVTEVANRRNLDLDYVISLATGEIFTGEQAFQLGLVDELGGLDYTIDAAAEMGGIKKPDIKIYWGRGMLSQLFGIVTELRESTKVGLRIRW